MSTAAIASTQRAQNGRSADMADADTPFIHNAWYVIALSSEVAREPIARTVLGKSVVLYRTMEAKPVALRNRCCHRSFPLSQGRLEGDTLVCGYHGLRYDTTGKCVEIPMQKSVPAAVRVHAFPLEERGDFIWIWMGEPSKAEAGDLPIQSWMTDPNWDRRHGYLHVKGSYVHLHENLLDLSHLSFLHRNSFGTPEYARAPVEMQINGDDIQVWRHVECKLPALYAKPLGWTDMRATRSSGSQFVSPALHVNTGIFRNLDNPTLNLEPVPTVKVAQLITPESNHTTHYWTLLARNFVRGDDSVSDFMINQSLAAFREDLFALEEISKLTQLENDDRFVEISIPTDRAGVLMRRRLKKLADLET
jgi:phenylpropionate dioxygenase-like ring-hydroxylating dioxygenase large terminal subunit